MVTIEIQEDKCENVDCGECVDMCPQENFVLGDGKIEIQHEDDCTLCEVCVDMCPNDCLTIKP